MQKQEIGKFNIKINRKNRQLQALIKMIIILALTNFMAAGMQGFGVSTENVTIVFLLGILITTVETAGYFWGTLASIIGVFCINFFFTLPTFSFKVYNQNHIMTFVIFLAVSIIVNTLATRLQQQAQIAKMNEKNTKLIYDINMVYLNVSGIDNIVEQTLKYLDNMSDRKHAIFLNDNGLSEPYFIQDLGNENEEATHLNIEIANWVSQNRQGAGYGTSFFEKEKFFYYPITGHDETLGVLAVFIEDKGLNKEEELFIETIASQMSIVLEREFISDEQEESSLCFEKEQLRNHMTWSMSRDLKKPLFEIRKASQNLLNMKGNQLNEKNVRDQAAHINKETNSIIDRIERLLSITSMDEIENEELEGKDEKK